ncbi:uncharacterized protein LOC113374012 isoform X1 [Ctenocephalides felis]|uniref:uncharacterized protein LOC113374012 isoform X1 n=1 Tax=Ctenocephalides felis TaxID=7515 RepID=UPI000E6E2CF8|nr:uncharacterized protein LOC113374012 isoform X1 [Ctenocephalides felis]
MSDHIPEGTTSFLMNCALGISSVWAMDNLDSKYKLYAFTLKIMALHAMVGIYNYVHEESSLKELISPRTDFFIRHCSVPIVASELFHMHALGYKDMYWHQLACGAAPLIVYACREPQNKLMNDCFLAFNALSMCYMAYFSDEILPAYLGAFSAINFKMFELIFGPNEDRQIFLLGLVAFNYLSVKCLSLCS